MQLKCPACKARMEVSADMAGQITRCTQCNAKLRVPNTTAVAPKPKAAPIPRERVEAVDELEEVVEVVPISSPRESRRSRERGERSEPKKKRWSLVPILLVVGLLGGLFAAATYGLQYFQQTFEKQVTQGAPAIPEPKKITQPGQMTSNVLDEVKAATVYLRVNYSDGSKSSGSGFLVETHGVVLTNAHVVGMRSRSAQPPRSVEATFLSGQPGEFTSKARIVGLDPQNDLAVLKVDFVPNKTPPFVKLGETKGVTELQRVNIFGFPFGERLGKDITVAESSVSSLRRRNGVVSQIQVNGGMHPGNSGGPVVDAQGQVIGIAVSAITGTQLHFAIPSERAAELLEGIVDEVMLRQCYLNEGRRTIPVRISVEDPLNQIGRVAVLTWSAPRGRTFQKGEVPNKTEYPSQQSYDADNDADPRWYKVEVPLPETDDSKDIWMMPIAYRKRNPLMGEALAAVVCKPIDPPLVHENVSLVFDFEKVKERTVDVKIETIMTTESLQPKVDQRLIQTQALETARKFDGLGELAFFLGAFRDQSTGPKPKIRDENYEMYKAISKSPFVFYTNTLGDVSRSFLPYYEPAKRDFEDTEIGGLQWRDPIRDFAEHVGHSFDAMLFPVANGTLKPMDWWRAKMRVGLSSGENLLYAPAPANFLCYYEGTQTKDGRKFAVVWLHGSAAVRDEWGKAVPSDIFGLAHFDLDHGYWSQIELGADPKHLQGKYKRSYTLTRTPGNSLKLDTTSYKRPRGCDEMPHITGKVIRKFSGVLTKEDPADLKSRPKRAYKTDSLPVRGKHAYLVQMRSVKNEKSFDPYLRVLDKDGKLVAENDDGGGGFDAQILMIPKSDQVVTLQITTCDPRQYGDFEVIIYEAPPPPVSKDQPKEKKEDEKEKDSCR